MRAIEFVKVDAKDGRPATEFPTRHGPADPLPGIAITHWEPGNPARYYGLVDANADTSVPGVIRVISGSEWEAITAARCDAACSAIDVAAGEARRRFISPGWLVEEEYHQALAAVEAWRAAGSPLDAVPVEVQTGADYEDLDAESAAQSIEQTAAAWREALSVIREARLNGKRAVREADALTLRSVLDETLGLLASMGQPGNQ